VEQKDPIQIVHFIKQSIPTPGKDNGLLYQFILLVTSLNLKITLSLLYIDLQHISKF